MVPFILHSKTFYIQHLIQTLFKLYVMKYKINFEKFKYKIYKCCNVYDSLYPLFYALRLVGLSTCKFSLKNNKPCYETTLFGAIYGYTFIFGFVGN